MLTACGFILFYGKVYQMFATKWVFLSGIFLFEVGSAVCGAAPNSLSLIIGRAVAGFGSSGIFTGSVNIMVQSVPLHRRPLFQGLFGAVFGVASVAGPLIGGAFTQGSAGWRWCFYINLPLGGFTVAALAIFLNLNEHKPKLSLTEKLNQLDPLGTLLFLPSIVCLLLALQWGGIEHPWSDGRVIAVLVVFGVLFIGFLIVQVINRNTNATIPARIFFQRSVFFGGIYQFLLGSTLLCTIVYIPLWFQAIKGTTPVKSGVDTIPLVLGLVVMSIFSGVAVQKLGYYTPFLYLGTIFMSVGAGLMTTLKADSSHSKWIGYQAILGMGVGLALQQANLAVQTCLPERDGPLGIALIFFFQTFGGAVFMSVGQNTFIDKFISQLRLVHGINPDVIGQTGATALRSAVPKDLLPQVIVAYNYAITHGPFLVSTIIACLSIIGALGMEWRSVKERKDQVGQVEDLEIGNSQGDGGMPAKQDDESLEEKEEKEEKPEDILQSQGIGNEAAPVPDKKTT
jgi:MFS family permease